MERIEKKGVAVTKEYSIIEGFNQIYSHREGIVGFLSA